MKIKVLVVEDHPVAQKIARLLLNSLNCDVTITNNGESALQLFSENDFDLIFADVGLPDKDGFTVVNEMRAHEKRNNKRRTSIFGLSVHTGASQRVNALLSGMDDYIVKPLTLNICNKILAMLSTNTSSHVLKSTTAANGFAGPMSLNL